MKFFLIYIYVFSLFFVGCKSRIVNNQSAKVIVDTTEKENQLKQTQEGKRFQRIELNEIQSDESGNSFSFQTKNLSIKIVSQDSIREFILYDQNENVKDIFKKNEWFEGIGLESSLYKLEKDSLLVVDDIYEYSETFQIFRLKDGKMNFIESIDVDTDIEKAENGIKTSSLLSLKKVSDSTIQIFYSDQFIKEMDQNE